MERLRSRVTLCDPYMYGVPQRLLASVASEGVGCIFWLHGQWWPFRGDRQGFMQCRGTIAHGYNQLHSQR